MKTRFIISYVITTFFLCSCAKDIVDLTANINGVVKDNYSHIGIEACKVTISPSNVTTSTSNSGQFSFENLDAGDYTLSLIKNGYESLTKTYTLTAGKNVNTELFLNPLTTNMEVSPNVLNFGDLETSLELFISKKVLDNVSYSIKKDADWISVSPTNGTISSTVAKISVVIDRSLLSVGEYTGNIIISGSKGDIVIPVHMSKVEESTPIVANSGDFYEINETSFKINGLLKTTGGYNITAHGHCWSEKELPTINDSKTNLGNTKNIGEFTSTVTQLITGKTYYVRAYATNKLGTSYSNQMMVTMNKTEKPQVETLDATEISKSSAKLNGRIISDGKNPITECGFYYGTTNNPNNKKSCASISNNFALELESLQEGTTYYFKSYAVNSNGESIGEVLSLTTPSDTKVIVSTLQANNIGTSSATLTGSITGRTDDRKRVVEYGFYYGKNEYQLTKVKVGTSFSSDNYEYTIKDLAPTTTYYFKAYAISFDNTKEEGSLLSFSTAAEPYVSYFKAVGTDAYDKTLLVDLTAKINPQGHTIKDAGFIFCFTYCANVLSLHYHDPIDIVKGTISDNIVSYSANLTDKTSAGYGRYVRAYFVLDDGTEVYSKDTFYVYGGSSKEITY